MKKKLLTVALSAMLALGLGTVAFAASEVAKDITADQVNTTAVAGAPTVVQGANAENIASTITKDKYVAEVKDVVVAAAKSEVAANMNIGAVNVKNVFELTGAITEDTIVKIQFTAADGFNPMVMHKKGDNWVKETLIDTDPGYIAFKPGTLSPFAIVEYKAGPAPAPAGGGSSSGNSTPAANTTTTVPSSPKTGAEFPMAAVVALAAMAGAAVCVKKFAVKE